MFINESKYYKYLFGIEITKAFAKLLVFVCVTVFLLFVTGKIEYNAPPTDYRFAFLYHPISGAIFGAIFSFYLAGSWCNVKLAEDGLYVEFFFGMRFIPWKDIREIKYLGPRPIGYWIVNTQGSLSVFHRLYALGTLPLAPSFQIHEQMEDKSELISIIKEKISINKKDKQIR